MTLLCARAIGLDDPAAYALVGLMLGVDRPLDMYRTMVNVTSDSIGAAVIAHTEGEHLHYRGARSPSTDVAPSADTRACD